jgi:hypothetical protein
MEIPGLGTVTQHDVVEEWYVSVPMPVSVLGGEICRIIVDSYGEDPQPKDFDVAIANFLSIGPQVLKDAEPDVFHYYRVCNSYWKPDDPEFVMIDSPAEIWSHIRLGDEPMITRRGYGDRGIYVSLACGCDWEPEHGLQIVFKNGLRVNKVGAYNGHCTNSDAYADDRLEDVIYYSP